MCLCLGAMLCLSRPAAADPRFDLNDAENSYHYGDFQRVIAKLEPLVGENIVLTDAKEIARAFELLGLASFFLDKHEAARRYFQSLIRREPSKLLDPVQVPPDAIAFYDQIRQGLIDEIKREQEALRIQAQLEAEQQRRERTRNVLVETRRNSKLVALMPFGVGQFQNEDPVMGGVFLASELTAIGMYVGFFVATEDLRLPNGKFAPETFERARSMQKVQLISGAVALVLMAAGATHALLTYREGIETHRKVLEPGDARLLGPQTGLFGWTF